MNALKWQVEGKTDTYTVTLERGIWQCSCPDQVYRSHLCRHIKAVSMLQRLALLDQESVNILEKLAKADEAEVFGRFEDAPKKQSVEEKLNTVFGE